MYSKRYISIFIILFCYQINSLGNTPISGLSNIDSSSSLSIVYGWFHDPKSDKWSTKENEIKGIDNFINYHILSFQRSEKKYVAIVKEQKSKGGSLYDTYIIDYENYISLISNWDEHVILKFPILKHHQAEIKKKEILSEEILGINDLSNLLTNPRDYFVFQYKFFPDATVKFLFLTETCSQDSCVPTGLNTKKEYFQYYESIGKDELYNDFFYKTTTDYFTKFIDSPLNK